MIILTIEELEEKGVDPKGKETISFQNKPYKRMSVLSKRFKSEVPKIVEEYNAESLSSIVVEHKFYFSIWKEEKPLDETKENLDSFVNQKLKDFGF